MAAFRPKLSRAPSIWADTDENVAGRLKDYAEAAGLDIAGGTVGAVECHSDLDEHHTVLVSIGCCVRWVCRDELQGVPQ